MVDANGLKLVLLVAVGGALGSVLRYLVSGALLRAVFPWGTFLVNVTGTFGLAFLFFFAMGRGYAGPEWSSFVFVGFFGGYTTLSTFGLETVNLLRDGRAALALANIGLNGGVCVVAAVLGAALGSWVG